jgi:purine-cytosine permease-like protein
VRWLRKVVVWLVLAATVYLFSQLLSEPLPDLTDGGWTGFGYATDTVIAVCVSYALLIGDYSRHSRTAKASFYGAWVGYGLAAIIYISLGIVAFSTVVELDGDVIAGLLAVPAGALALLILTVDEVDEAFANIYSTTMSVHNLAPNVDRRRVSIAVGVIATSLALVIDLSGYQSFLFLIGSVFVPLTAVMITDWFLVSRGRWNLSESSPLRPAMLGAWVSGFVAYQLVNPGGVAGWNDLADVARRLLVLPGRRGVDDWPVRRLGGDQAPGAPLSRMSRWGRSVGSCVRRARRAGREADRGRSRG